MRSIVYDLPLVKRLLSRVQFVAGPVGLAE